jgi:hypothetical protein
MPTMTPEWQEQNQTNKRNWCLGDQKAIDFLNCFFDAVELWDDLIDKDVPIEDAHVNRVFTSLMFVLPANPWFVANYTYYQPLIMASINGFHDANEMCKSDKKHLRNLAFHIRNLGIEIHIATAFLIGGFDHMRKVSREIREFYAFETFENWEINYA